MAQESPQPPVARPVARSASGNASALDPHNKIKAELRVEFGERFLRHVEKTRDFSGVGQLALCGGPFQQHQIMPETAPSYGQPRPISRLEPLWVT